MTGRPGRTRRSLFAAAGATLALTAAACGGSGGDDGDSDLPDTVRIAYQTIPNGAPILKNLAWLEDELGVTIEWNEFSSGAEVNRAVAGGSVDIGLAGSSPVTSGIAQGLDYKVVWIYDVLGENEALVATAESGITTVEDLPGHTIGTPFGSTTHYSLLAAMDQAGVAPEDVEILDMQPQDALAAWQRGDIDGAYVWIPVLAEMRDDGGTVVVTSGDLAEQGIVTADLGIVSTDFAEQYPDVVRTWIEQEDRAVQLYRDDPDAAAAAVAEEFGLDAAEARSQMDELVWLDAAEQAGADYLGTPDEPGAFVDAMEAAGEFLAGQDLIDSAPSRDDLEAAIDPGFLSGGS